VCSDYQYEFIKFWLGKEKTQRKRGNERGNAEIKVQGPNDP